jgi:hypothetical protein
MATWHIHPPLAVLYAGLIVYSGRGTPSKRRRHRENMRKLMVLAAMLAMVLVSAAPALAQGDVGDVNLGDDQFNVGDETVYSAGSQNIIGSFDVTATQSATSVAVAAGGDNAVANATIDQSQDISVTQTNRSFNNVWVPWWWWF